MIKKSVISLILFSIIYFAGAQEFLVPALHNIKKLQIENSEKPDDFKTKSLDTLKLPFFDDFTNEGPYPDQKLWADSFVFINSSFGYHPKTFGVATFDALDQYGNIYEEGESNYYQFEADFLTSLPIRLDSLFLNEDKKALFPSDSVILSFYYQPQGKGLAPRDRDSLVVQFLKYSDSDKNLNKNKDEDAYWVTVWSASGENLESFAGDNFPYFKRAIIKIEDEDFFRKDFRFRFMNYASFPADKTPTNYAGNISIWNIDYVYLDANRTLADTFYYDIAFAAPAQSILHKYTSMPWGHYIQNPNSHLRSNFNVYLTNLGDITYNYSYRYYITDEDRNLLKNYSGGTWNIAPFHVGGYQDYPSHTNPIVISNPLPTAAAPERTFYIYHAITEGSAGDWFQRNDTIIYEQKFLDYYAYDDGVPEAGYGLSGWEPMGAYRFVAGKPDVLSSVSFYFNPTQFSQNQRPMHLMVWKSLDPEEILYESEVIIPEFEDELFSFANYSLSSPVNIVDTFYVGWKQLTSDFINIGFDVNNDSGDNIFFNVDGQWQQSMYSGALMIRPHFDETTSIPAIRNITDSNLSVFPNPTNGGVLSIISDNILENATIQIFDIKGNLRISEKYSREIIIQSLLPGTYILRVIDTETNFRPVRFIVIR